MVTITVSFSSSFFFRKPGVINCFPAFILVNSMEHVFQSSFLRITFFIFFVFLWLSKKIAEKLLSAENPYGKRDGKCPKPPQKIQSRNLQGIHIHIVSAGFLAVYLADKCSITPLKQSTKPATWPMMYITPGMMLRADSCRRDKQYDPGKKQCISGSAKLAIFIVTKECEMAGIQSGDNISSPFFCG